MQGSAKALTENDTFVFAECELQNKQSKVSQSDEQELASMATNSNEFFVSESPGGYVLGWW